MRITLSTLQKMAQEGIKITQLTCYDASFAAVLEEAGVETLLIGDSLGNVLQGHESTLPVTLHDMVYHTACVARGAKRAFVIGDMPFGTFQISPQEAFRNAAEIMAAGAHMVKLEGGRPMLETVRFLTERGIPVCGHLGLTPQSVHQLGGFRQQDFWLFDLGTGAKRRLTQLDHGESLQRFDVSRDGTRIVFERVRENSDIVLIELPVP